MDQLVADQERRDDIISFFEFVPSKAVAIVALVLFGVAAMAVLAQTVRSRAWFMLIAVIVALLEVGGFACRIRMLSVPLRGVYIIMQCLLIIPPSFLSLVDYIVLGRLVALIQSTKPAATKFQLKPKVLTWVFFGLEIGSLACQGAGAGLSVNGDDAPDAYNPNANAGKVLLIVGLAALVGLMGFFLFTTIYAHRSPQLQVPGRPFNVRIVYLTLYLTTGLLLVRNIFRVIEFSQGWYGFIARHEVYFYIFDSLVILSWLALVVPLHFGILLKRAEKELAVISGPGAKHYGAGHDVAASTTEMV